MAPNFSLRFSNFCNTRKVVLSDDRLSFKPKLNVKEQGRAKYALPKQVLLKNLSTSQKPLFKWIPLGAVSSSSSSSMALNWESGILEDEHSSVNSSQSNGVEFNRVNSLVWVLHESARSFSNAIQTLEFARTGPPVAMAWNGIDVNGWHKHIAYQVAAYALLKAVIEVELFLSHNRSNNPSPVHQILSPNTDFLRNHIESQLKTRNPKLVQWFQMVELPRISGLFMPLFKKWSVEYAGSGVAGTIMAITCCAAIGNLGSGRISCSSFSNSVEEALVELMTMAHGLVSVDKLHHLASDAGFEDDFLCHFGREILPSKTIEDIEFWIGLVQRKLLVAFQRESVINGKHDLSDKIQENNLATLALFAYLGRESGLFLSKHNIKDVEEQIKDFLSYLECGILFVYPEFSTLSVYQLLMEVIIDEIGWLDFFAAYRSPFYQEGRRSKHQPNQAEKEIILYAVLTTCYDIISGFAHYSSSTQQTLEAELLEFLLQSQGLLSTCLDDYWAAYDKTGHPPKIGERSRPDSVPSFPIKGTKNSALLMDELRNREKDKHASPRIQVTSSSHIEAEMLCGLGKAAASIKHNFLRKYAMKFVAATVDVWMGTQLLFVDISEAMRFIGKKLCGHKITIRERKKMQRTMSDVATLIPITILMLLPVSAVGHAAMFTAIKRYIPFLIPSPFSDERVNLVKQLKRTKKMEVQRVNIEETTSKLS